MGYGRAALLNLIPGFGLGYLVVGRQGGFIISLTAWLVIASVVIGGIIGFALFIADDYILLPLELFIGGGFALGALAVNVPGAIHLSLVQEDTDPVPLSYRIVGSFFMAATLVAVLITGGVFLFIAMGPGRDVRQVDSLALSPGFERDSTLFARAGDQGVLYRSTNAGASWRQAFDPPAGYLAHGGHACRIPTFGRRTRRGRGRDAQSSHHAVQ